MMRLCLPKALVFAACLLSAFAGHVEAAIRINEVSDKGTSETCQGNDWIELFNEGPDAVDLSDGYVLHDDKGMDEDHAFSFPASQNAIILANEYLLLCTKLVEEEIADDNDFSPVSSLADPMSPQFGISGKDTIALVRVATYDPIPSANTTDSDTTPTDISMSSSLNRQMIYTTESSVQLPNTDDGFDVTYAFNSTSGEYQYTSTPTPGTVNVLTSIPSPEERLAEQRQAMITQNALGSQFFGMDDRGFKVERAMDDVLNLYIEMPEEDYAYLMANKSFELYRSFESGKLTTVEGTEIARLDSPGKIRVKGQSTLFMSICLGTDTMPFQIDFSSVNKSQSLFGVEKLYLRHHMADYSYLRDYAYNRMLARFGLPHLRVRKVQFYLNQKLMGYYSLMEAMDQEYVFARHFPLYNPDSFALYKMKSMSLECGSFSQAEMDAAALRVDEISTPPYAFQRGEHQPVVETKGLFAVSDCLGDFVNKTFESEAVDVVVAYQRYDEDCAAMLMGEGLVDRDLGNKDYDKAMAKFITNDFRGDVKCDEKCTNSDLPNDADVEQMLKMFAFYAVVVTADSPLINGNNFYLAQSGDEDFGGPGGWKIVPYDFNAARVVFCHDNVCNTRMVHWSIARPTCESLEANNIVGPLLTNPEYHAKYLEYVREFTDTVYANATFIDELVDHQAIQKSFVTSDFWSLYGAFYDKELTPEAANWEEEGDRFPLLPTMKARAADVKAQLAAIADDSFARGPHIGATGDNEKWEYCPDWRSEKVNSSACEQGCKYEGCSRPGWTVESFCDELTGNCLHGDYDEQCRGLRDGEQYTGMAETDDGRPTFCKFAQGIPTKAAECPEAGALPALSSATEASAVSYSIAFALVLALTATASM